ncbi:uncharacterized protein LOC134384056 [Cynocephalus volans]|uniref:uncharacterized protein LOC134384056 n=1 Tax=Cynocephalus volans TaxID=110931 RepID=UPI002FC97859
MLRRPASPRRASHRPRPQRAPAHTSPPQRPPPPLPGPAPRPASSRARWLRKERERTESKTSWRPTAISCTFCKCHRVKINRPPLRPAGSPQAHDPAPAPGAPGLSVWPDPPFPRAPWSPAPRHSSASHHALLCHEAKPQVTGGPAISPLVSPAPPQASLLSVLHQTPPDPLPRCRAPPGADRSTRPPARQPSVPRPGAQLLSQRTQPPRQLPRTFPRTQAGAGPQPSGSEPVPQLAVPSAASPGPGEAGGGVGGEERHLPRLEQRT